MAAKAWNDLVNDLRKAIKDEEEYQVDYKAHQESLSQCSVLLEAARKQRIQAQEAIRQYLAKE